MLGLLPVAQWQRTSLAALIVANLVPLIGVLALDWDLYGVMVLYWAENSIIGFYNVLKMLRIGGATAAPRAVFFCVHYGMFMFVHFVFVKKLFGPNEWGLFPSVDQVIDALRPVAGSLAATFISHGVSYYTNFLRGREYERTTADEQMHAPYKRMAILHVTIIAAGWIIASQGGPVGALVIFIVLKTCIDGWAHLREHGRLSGDGAERVGAAAFPQGARRVDEQAEGVAESRGRRAPIDEALGARHAGAEGDHPRR